MTDEIKELIEAIKSAIVCIRDWHGMGMSDTQESTMWKIYNEGSPEMKRINAVLAKYDKDESILSRPEQGGEEGIIKHFLGQMTGTEWGTLFDTGKSEGMYNPLYNILYDYTTFAQLRTAQLRSELDEAKREIERLNERMELLSKMRE